MGTLGRKVLVVDDQQVARRPLCILLMRAGFKVREAANGKEALKLVLQEPPDLVLTDLAMPVMNGFDLIELLKANPLTARIPVLVLSGMGARQDVVRAIRAGASDYLVKASFRKEGFLDRVHQALKAMPPVAAEAAAAFPPAAPSPAERPVPAKPAAAAEDPETRKQRIVREVAKAEDLAALPASAVELLSLIDMGTGSASDLARVIVRDQSLTARVIRVANSSYYGGRRRNVTDVHSAVVTVGVRSLAHIAVGLSVMDRFASAREAGLNVRAFFEHSIGCAVIARGLAAVARHPAPEEVFTYGMLHDIGKVFLAQTIPAEYAAAVAQAAREGRPLRAVEQELLGIDHCAVGRRLCRRWGMPETIAEVLFLHNDPWEKISAGRTRDPDGLTVTWLANLCAKTLALGHGGDGTLDAVPQDAWDSLGIGHEAALRVLNSAREEMVVLRVFLLSEGEVPAPPPEGKGRVLLQDQEGFFPWVALALESRGCEVEVYGADDFRGRVAEWRPQRVVLESDPDTAEARFSLARAIQRSPRSEGTAVAVIHHGDKQPPADVVPPEFRQAIKLHRHPLFLDALVPPAQEKGDD